MFYRKQAEGIRKKSGTWLRAILLQFYDILTLDHTVQSADLIFVMAGRMGRKAYGMELYQRGYAPRLLLSVGRFEVSKMRGLGFAGSEALELLRNQSAPEERHFFVLMDSTGIHIERASLQRWSTYGEALGLREFLSKENVRSVLVISSAIHLRRVAFTFAQVFRDRRIHFSFCPTPAEMDFLEKDRWWRRPAERRLVLSEMVKLAGYWLILQLPPWAARRLMRLKS